MSNLLIFNIGVWIVASLQLVEGLFLDICWGLELRTAKDNGNILDSKKINIFLNEYSGF